VVAEEVAVAALVAVVLPVAEEVLPEVLHAVSPVVLPVEDLVEASEEVVEVSKGLLHTQKKSPAKFHSNSYIRSIKFHPKQPASFIYRCIRELLHR
jgi:hypothetical protein